MGSTCQRLWLIVLVIRGGGGRLCAFGGLARDPGGLFVAVNLHLGLGDHLGQFAHTDSVEGVVFIQRLERGLVKCGQRD